jgi:alpha-amylase/alpha-mannosidase (GH57 family)
VTEKISVCFVWHMHQPLYKDRSSGLYLMPWVRMHGIKDYLDMPLLLENYPRIRQTFNIVPSLLEQLEDYAEHEAVDQQLLLTCKDENEYTFADRLAILSESFHASLDGQIKPHRPYYDLYLKRESLKQQGMTAAAIVDLFSRQELADMATWFNLAWFDPLWLQKEPEIRRLIEQGRGFTLAQRRRVIEIERSILRQTIPVYRRLCATGQIETTTSPYYHPILPLLIDTNAALLPTPAAALPSQAFQYPQDARQQVERGLRLYEKFFGITPQGMWPSELAASPAALSLVAGAGIKWVVLDEEILARTVEKVLERDEHGNLNSAELLCQPYRLHIGEQEITIFFRELVTSNEISFFCAGRQPAQAAQALCLRLKHIRDRLAGFQREGVVLIALDGENCWANYESDGHPFLNELYRRLSEDESFNVCTVSDYLERNPPTVDIYKLHAGSWIAADYHIWIGDPVKNKAWDLLKSTRQFLEHELAGSNHDEDVKNRCLEEIYAAEGSDWFWWFGEPNSSAHDHVFDEQFRLRLQNVYRMLKHPYPDELDLPVSRLATGGQQE